MFSIITNPFGNLLLYSSYLLFVSVIIKQNMVECVGIEQPIVFPWCCPAEGLSIYTSSLDDIVADYSRQVLDNTLTKEEQFLKGFSYVKALLPPEIIPQKGIDFEDPKSLFYKYKSAIKSVIYHCGRIGPVNRYQFTHFMTSYILVCSCHMDPYIYITSHADLIFQFYKAGL